mgnify:CR=1 FL=1
MRNTLLVTLLILLLNPAIIAQIIGGQTVDADSNQPVPFANVYLEGTTIGTTSNSDGYFILDLQNKSTIPLVVSTIGYQSYRTEDYSKSEKLLIKLKPNRYDLEAFEVKARKISRQPKLRIFKEAFLGRSKNAANCIIENEYAIMLEESPETKTLYAYANEPLIIINKALGYKIDYHLKEFRCSGEDVFYSGTYFFTELETEDKAEIRRRKKNRLKTYKGSRLNLIRSFYNKNLNKNNFEVYYSNYKKLKSDEIYQKDLTGGDKLIYFTSDLIVYYIYVDEEEIVYLNQERTEKVATSYIKQKGGLRVTRDGYFDPHGVVWSGDISFYRVADLLPYDYVAQK